MTVEAEITIRQSTLDVLEEMRGQMEDYDDVINRLIDPHKEADEGKAYGAVEKEALDKLGEVCVDLWEGTPAYNQLSDILLEIRAIGKITPWDTEVGPFTTNVSKIWCLPLIQYKRLRELHLELTSFLDHAKQCFDEKIYGTTEAEG